jgi:hypothetical protein
MKIIVVFLTLSVSLILGNNPKESPLNFFSGTGEHSRLDADWTL